MEPAQFHEHSILKRFPLVYATDSQASCEYFKHDFEVLWVRLEQILQLEVGCLNFGSVQDSGINLTYPTMLFFGWGL